jgi:hypothetical protein
LFVVTPYFRQWAPACVHRDIAAERASELARRIRGIKEAFCRDGIGDGDIGDAGLDAGRAVRHVDGEHFGHARDAEHDRVTTRGERVEQYPVRETIA